MSLEDLKIYVDSLRGSDELFRKPSFRAYCRFVERGFLTEALMVFHPEEILDILEKGRLWSKIPAWHINAWKNYLKDYASLLESEQMR